VRQLLALASAPAPLCVATCAPCLGSPCLPCAVDQRHEDEKVQKFRLIMSKGTQLGPEAASEDGDYFTAYWAGLQYDNRPSPPPPAPEPSHTAKDVGIFFIVLLSAIGGGVIIATLGGYCVCKKRHKPGVSFRRRRRRRRSLLCLHPPLTSCVPAPHACTSPCMCHTHTGAGEDNGIDHNKN
jgi:hypothetical protein